MPATQDSSARVVLVVDDEPLVLYVMDRTLEEAGYVVLQATSAIEALDYFRQERPRLDAVVTDVNMDPIDGASLASLLRQLRPDLPVLFVSGFDTHLGTLPGPLLGKPFLPDQLVGAVNALLHRAPY